MHVFEYLQGLFHECKSNVERMVERIPDSNYQQLQHFISESEWDEKAVMKEVARKTNQSLATLKGEKGLILDESGNEKAGDKSVGVARQYIGNVGKVCNSQVGVYAGLSRADKISLVRAKLSLPKEWTSDKKRCEKAGIPTEEQKYRTKPELGLEIIKEIEGVIEYDWVGGDSIYGNSPKLRVALRELGKAFVMDVGEELQVCLEKPHPFVPESRGKGRNRSRYVIEEKKISLKNLVGEIQASEWKTIKYREGTKGKLVREAVLMKVWIWQKETAEVEEAQVLISRKLDQTEIKYSLCDAPVGKLNVETALFRQMQRYWIERGFQEIKEQIGLHQYQVRGWRAWQHHIALTMMALHFILETQIENAENLPLMSCGDVKLMLGNILKNKLDEPEILMETIHQRHRVRQKDIVRRRQFLI
ncbi:MAG: IS701 family transposase [Pyrinomonadaceae bacterium]|nr:IS701 family transposase [Pyrinomonadaceae bacterium]